MNEISVYCADLSVWSMKDCYAVLSGAERQRASLIFDPRARHEFVATRAILRLLLAKHTGLPAATLRLGTGEYGKPLLLDGNLHFNASHSGGKALIAIAPTEVGVDIERIDSSVDLAAVARSVFAPAEIAMLRNAPERKALDVFFSLWTRKEAYLKATGRGFSSDLHAISVVRPHGAIEDRSTPLSRRSWLAVDLPSSKGFKAALVTASRDPKIEFVAETGVVRLLARDMVRPGPIAIAAANP
jgi:4'-phosphopantetheinyl transferase